MELLLGGAESRYSSYSMIVFALAGLAVISSGQNRPAVRAPKLPQVARATVGDELTVVVAGFAEYSTKVTVVADGTISLPPVGVFKVQGRSLEEIQTTLTAKLRPYVRDPRVTVGFVNKADSVVYVVGLEGTDARQPYRLGLDLRSILSGVKSTANTEDLEGSVYRSGKRIAGFNVRELLTGSRNVWSGPLAPGDVVTIVPIERVRVWFLNDFVKVGEAQVIKGATLAQGVAQVGGARLPDEGNERTPGRLANRSAAYLERSRILVRRGGEERRFLIKNDPAAEKFVLEAGDTISLELPRPATVAVQGFVRTPAPVTLLAGDDVSAAIASAGGVSEGGTLDGVLLLRGGEVRRLDLRGLSAPGVIEPAKSDALAVPATPGADAAPGTGGAPAAFASVQIQDGDTLFIPRNERVYRILGDAKNPGVYAIPDNLPVRADQALARAGGLSPEGSFRRIVLLRADENGVYRARQFNLDEYIKDGKKEANPEILAGDVLFLNKPKGGPTTRDLLTALPNLFLISSTIRR
ncbi:MAG: hypothetical protein C4320_04105 [Armatimonadota bacterium]